MNQLTWVVAVLIAAILLDGMLIWIWRSRNKGMRLSLASWRSAFSMDRAGWLTALTVLGALIILISQLSKSAYNPETSGIRLTPAWLGVVIFAGASTYLLLLRRSRKASAPDQSSQEISTNEHGLLNLPKLELGIMLLGSICLIFLSRMFIRNLDGTETILARGLTIFGIGLFALAALGFRPVRSTSWPFGWLMRTASWLEVSKAQVVLLVMAPALSLYAWLAAGRGMLMRQPILAISLWLLAILVVVIGSLNGRPNLKDWKEPRKDLALAAGLFLGAFLLRGVATAEFPWLLTGDEASSGMSAINFIRGEQDNIFGLGWFSFPALYFYLQSLSIRLFGQTIEALRITSAFAGALTVAALYWFLSQAFGRWIALAGSFLLAASHFHIHFSRIGLNNIWDGFFIVFISASFWWGWSKNERLGYVLAGLGIGLSQYFYASSRVFFLLFPLWLAVSAVRDWSNVRAQMHYLAIMALSAVVIALPLAMHYAVHPNEFLAPMTRVSFLGRSLELEVAATGKTAAQLLVDRFMTSALAFTSADLHAWYRPETPILLPISASLFIMGVVLLLLNIYRRAELWLILWIGGAVVIGGLSESTPAAQRYVFAAPAVAAVAAIGLVQVTEWLVQIWPRLRPALIAAGMLVIAIACWGDVNFYFGDFSANKRFGGLNTETAQALATLLNERESGPEVFFLGGRMGYYTHSSIQYLAPDAIGHDIFDSLTLEPDWAITRPTLFVSLPERASELQQVQDRFPGGTWFEVDGHFGQLFVAYEIESS